MPLHALTLRGRRFAIQFAVSLVFLLGLLMHVGGVVELGVLSRLDALVYDYKLRLDMPETVEDRVVVVDIDENSLQEIGRWPWPREQVARLTENLLQQYGVAALGYDIVFAETDQSSGLPVLERLARHELAGEQGFAAMVERLRPSLDYDARLAEALAGGASVLGYYFDFSEGSGTVNPDGLPAPLIDCDTLHSQGVRPLKGQAFSANLPALIARAGGAGFFNMEADFDGVARRISLVVEHQGKCYGSLALLTTQQAMGLASPIVHPASRQHPASLDLDGLAVPMDRAARILVPYRAPGTFQYVSAADVIAGRAPANLLEGRAALIGSTAPGIMDLRVTPTARAFPGVEIHANVISGILDGTVKWEPASRRAIDAALVLGFGLILALLLPILTPIWSTLVAVAGAGALLGTDYALWHVWNLHLTAAAPLAAIIGLFVINMSYGFFVEARSKAQITRLFGQYVPPELVDEMAKDPARYSLRGESRVMSVLFSDIVGFTSISEKLEAAQLAEMLNVYLSGMTRVVQDYNGTIDKYIGDAVMAFWGAPMSDEHHARDAVLAALAMQRALEAINPELQARGWPAVRIGVGVNTGRMSVGNMGSEFRMAYTVMADAVNLASRLEALTRQYGVWVLVGEATRAQCDDIVFVPVDRVRVKGKDEPVAIFEPLGLAGEVDPARLEWAAEFELALADYFSRNWDAASSSLRALNARVPLKLHEVYLERIARYRDQPPPSDWDGAYTFTSK